MTESNPDESRMVMIGDIQDLLEDVRAGRHELDGTELDGCRFGPDVARALISAAPEGAPVRLGGCLEGGLDLRSPVSGALCVNEVDGDLRLRAINGGLEVRGALDGHLGVEGPVQGDVRLGAPVDGTVSLKGVQGSVDVQRIEQHLAVHSVKEDVRLWGPVLGSVLIHEGIGGSVSVGQVPLSCELADGYIIGGDLQVFGHIEECLLVNHPVLQGIVLTQGSSVSHLWIRATVSASVSALGHVEDAAVSGSIEGALEFSGSVGKGGLEVAGSISDLVEIQGPIAGDVTLKGSIGGSLRVHAEARGSLSLLGSVRGDTVLIGAENAPLTLASVSGSRFGEGVEIGEFVSVESCDMRNAIDMENFSFTGSFSQLFPSNRGLLNEEMISSPDEYASINRRLRATLEGRRNRPASSIFYAGEMDGRRRSAWESGRYAEGIIISAYRLLSGYGLRAARPAAWFAAVAVVGWIFYWATDLEGPVGPPLFAVWSMLSIVSPPDADLSDGQRWFQLVLRIVGPLLVAQTALAVRERIAR